MNENDFREHVTHYRLKDRDTIIPTTASILLLGHQRKTRIIEEQHHEHFYSLVKDIKSFLPDERLAELRKQKLDDDEILDLVTEEYDAYLKDLRKQIIALQKSWSKSYAHERAGYLIDYLGYTNIYHICDLVVQRNVPYELILELIFNVKSTYGEFRTPTPKEDIYIDPRIKKVLKGSEEIPASK